MSIDIAVGTHIYILSFYYHLQVYLVYKMLNVQVYLVYKMLNVQVYLVYKMLNVLGLYRLICLSFYYVQC